MLILKLGYHSYALPDECGPHLFALLSEIKPVKSEGYGDDEKLSLDPKPLEISIKKVLYLDTGQKVLPDVSVSPPKAPKTLDDEIPF